MQSKPTSPVPPVDPESDDGSLQVIDIDQWQMEIDNFIEETSAELNQIAKVLEAGPIRSETKTDSNDPASVARAAISALKQSDNQSASGESVDRLAMLKQKFASRIDKASDADEQA